MKSIDSKDLNVRIMKEGDLNSILEIDRLITGKERTEYFRRKLASALSRTEHLVTSLVAEYKGEVVGFIMGDVFLGEFGIPETTACIDTIGVAPEFQRGGIARTLMENFEANVRAAGVDTLSTRIEWNDWGLLRFFESQGFRPAPAINLVKKIQ